MTQGELRAWRDWLLEEGKSPRPFGSAHAPEARADHAAAISESEYDYEPVIDKVIERSADGERYIVGVRNGDLQRLQNVPDDAEPTRVDGATRPLTAVQVHAILNTLTDAQRLCLRLLYVEGHSPKEVAECTGFTEKQVKSHLQHSLRNFSSARKAISEDDVKSSLLRNLRPLTSR
jgi:DNA-directed RNA polymerase specialized sigma24 family protein